MKVFAINLKREPKKREHITRECQRLGLDFEIYDAVDGNTLSEDFLKKNVLDYGHNFLTKGEIGCALSHIGAYKRIIQEGLPYALILEDDAVLDNKLNDFIVAFETSWDNKEGVYLLTGDVNYVENKNTSLLAFNIYPVRSACGTTGYIITQKAAKQFADFLLPVTFEADMFTMFQSITGVPTYVVIPHIVSVNDKDKLNSSLEGERATLAEKRKAHRLRMFSKMKKKRTLLVRISRLHWRIFAKRTERIKRYADY